MPQVYPHLHVVLLADDYGEELWPLARQQAPACLAPAAAGGRESLLASIAHHLRPCTDAPLHIVTTAALAPTVADELGSYGVLDTSDWDLVRLPVRHGSAFAYALACACARHKDPDAVVVGIPANLAIEFDERWDNVLYRAFQVALRGRIALLCSPDEVQASDISYLRAGAQFENIDGSFGVHRFSAHAKATTARRALSEGALCYTGIFAVRAATLLGGFGLDGLPGDAGAFERIPETANFFSLLDQEAWQREEALSVIDALPAASIEEAVLTGSDALVALPFGASVSALSALADLDSLMDADNQGNRIFGAGIAPASRGVTAYAQEGGRTICAYGLDDVLVVDTADALLVADKRQLRDTMRLHDALAESPEAAQPAARRSFGWGTALLLASTPESFTWRVELRPGAVFEPFALAFEYGCFADHKKTARMSLRIQCQVASGDVVLEDEGGPASLAVHGAGDAFESGAGKPKSVMCVEEGPACLIVTAVLPGMKKPTEKA